MKNSIIRHFAVACASLACCVPTEAQVDIQVNLSRKGIEISPTLYGIFYEDINFASDGGLYAELIRNRSMEYNKEKPEHWEGLDCDITLTTDNMLNEKQGHALRMQVTRSGGGIVNKGYWGINAVQGTVYQLSFWARMEQGNAGTLCASLVSKDGRVLGKTQIKNKLGKKWKKIETTIVAEGSDTQAEFRLTAEKPCVMVADMVSLFPPTFKGRKNGCRIDLAEKLAALHPSFMRFPGGCYVEGSKSPENSYHWERTVGPVERRPGHENANWGYPTTDGLGFHEFLQLAEDLGAKPLYVVNIGIWHGGCTPLDSLQGWIDECLGALEYANGPVTSHYGKMRADNGHPEPFGIEFIEIGNENYNWHMEDNRDQSDHYPERYRMFYDAIKAHYPEVKCIGNVESWGTDTPKWRNSHPVDILDEHYYRTPQWFVDQYHRFDNYDRRGPVIYPGEYAVTNGYGTTGNLNAALGEAVFMMGMENNADIVRMSSYAPIFVNENCIQWRPDMIRFNSGKSFGTPSYWVQSLFPTHVGNRLVQSQMQWQMPSETELSENTLPIQVGVGTWKTNASFRNAQLTVDGKTVDLEDMDKWENSASGTDGQWSVSNGVLSQQGNAEGAFRISPKASKCHKYTYQVEARKDSGQEGFLITFGYTGKGNYSMFNVGGWDNTRTTVEQAIDGNKTALAEGSPFRVEQGRWYTISVEVEADSVVCKIDGKEEFRGKLHGRSMKGVYTNSTLDEANGILYTKVVNLGETGTTGTLTVSGGELESAEMVRLNSASGDGENTMEYPHNIVPRPAKVHINGNTVTFPVAPFSINIISSKVR